MPETSSIPGLALDAARLLERLRAADPSIAVQVHAEAGSTNDLAMAHLRAAGDSLAAPLLVAAERQTAGRGRLGRAWHSPPGLNLAFSLALPLQGIPEATPTAFNLAAAAIVCAAIERSGALRPAIKWPNDVHLGDRKLAGILSELPPVPSGRAPAGKGGIVVGIGLNVNSLAEHFPPELQETAVSLRQASGAPWDRQALLENVAADLIALAASRRPDAWNAVAAAWRVRCDTLGRWVTAVSGGERISGTAQGLESDGALVVRLPEGGLRRIEGGEVTLEKRSG